jgi:predicted RNA-binding protein YlqC (UPF0109 family)
VNTLPERDWSRAVHFCEKLMFSSSKSCVFCLPVLCLSLNFFSGLAVWTKIRNIWFMQAVTDRLKNFLQFVAVKLIDKPEQAQLKVAELGPKRLRFKLVLNREDVAMLIGRNGFTASAIRSVLKAAAEKEGVQVTLQIHSHEEEAELMAREV